MIVLLNAGSSTIKFSVYDSGKILLRRLVGSIDHLTSRDVRLSLSGPDRPAEQGKLSAGPVAEIAIQLFEILENKIDFTKVKAIGYRVVHGFEHTRTCRIDDCLRREMKANLALDPDHLPNEMALIDMGIARHPLIHQFASFDTAFHHDMPAVAKRIGLPRKYEKLGLHRYGFHGLSCTWLMKEILRIRGSVEADRRIILAHLGSGSSMTAVHLGKSMDTSMGFTPAAGLLMGTRCGDMDPGVAYYLFKTKNLSADQFNDVVNHQSGLQGVSETTGDMKELLEASGKDSRAADAVALYCYQAKKYLGAYAAALGGLDLLAFTGGIGQNAAEIRKRICDGLEFLGINLAPEANKNNAEVISAAGSRITVLVIPANEEDSMACDIQQLLK